MAATNGAILLAADQDQPRPVAADALREMVNRVRDGDDCLRDAIEPAAVDPFFQLFDLVPDPLRHDWPDRVDP